MKKIFIISLLIIQGIMFFSCKKSAEVPEVNAANLEVSSFAVTGERDEVRSSQEKITSVSTPSGDTAAGYVYTITLGVTETIGGIATINSVNFSFYNNGDLFGTYTPDVTSVFNNTRISAGTTVMANEKRVASAADDPYADEIRVEIGYTDETAAAKTTTATYNGPQYQDADLVVVQGSVSLYRLYGVVYGEADVKNRGTRDATSYTLILHFYDSSDSMINLMIKEMNETLRVNGRKTVTGVCTTSAFNEVVSYRWRVQWTKADGTTTSKCGKGTL